MDVRGVWRDGCEGCGGMDVRGVWRDGCEGGVEGWM